LSLLAAAVGVGAITLVAAVLAAIEQLQGLRLLQEHP
jgi:hypothetical protein